MGGRDWTVDNTGFTGDGWIGCNHLCFSPTRTEGSPIEEDEAARTPAHVEPRHQWDEQAFRQYRHVLIGD